MILETALLCLTLNAYHEARGELFEGQVAVNQVAMRRAGYDQRKVCRVIYAPGQFSWTAIYPRGKGVPKVKGPEWRRAELAARLSIAWAFGDLKIPDYSKDADHYHSVRVRPSWTRCARLTTQIDRHRFYTDVRPCLRSVVPTRLER